MAIIRNKWLKISKHVFPLIISQTKSSVTLKIPELRKRNNSLNEAQKNLNGQLLNFFATPSSNVSVKICFQYFDHQSPDALGRWGWIAHPVAAATPPPPSGWTFPNFYSFRQPRK